jgi:hypothetical protein
MGLPPLKLFNVKPPSEGTLALIGNRHGDQGIRTADPAPRPARTGPSTGAWTPMSPPFSLVQGASYAANLDIGEDGRDALSHFGGDTLVRYKINKKLQDAGFGSVQIIHLAGDGARVTGVWTHPSMTGDLPTGIKAAFVDQATLPAPSAASPSTSPAPSSPSTPAQIHHGVARPAGSSLGQTPPTTRVPMTRAPIGWVTHVKDVQEALILRAILPARDPRTGKPNNDGWRYMVTDAAVKRAQAIQGLPETGVVDTQTWTAIQSLPIPLPGQGGMAAAPQPYAPLAGPITAPTAQKPGAAATFDDKKDKKEKDEPSFLESLGQKAKDNPVATFAITIGIIGWTALLLPAPAKAPVGQKA